MSENKIETSSVKTPKHIFSSFLFKFRFHIATVFITWIAIEIIAGVFFEFYGRDRFWAHIQQDVQANLHQIDRKLIARFKMNAFDRDLGWDQRPNRRRTKRDLAGAIWKANFDEMGRRVIPFKGKVVKISSYGDSYTLGGEVNGDQTWQFFLSELTETKVLNYGVDGYGTDQAVLKLKRNFERGRKTEIVVLGIWSENINRIMNVYRQFYLESRSPGLLFKPMLHKVDEKYEWLPNPLQTLEGPGDVVAAFEIAKKNDLWYRLRQRRPSIGFPYILAALSFARYGAFYMTRDLNLWRMPEAIEKLEEIIRIGYRVSESYGARLLVLFIPTNNDLKLYSKGQSSTYRLFVEKIRKSYENTRLVVVDTIEERFDADKFSILPYRGHASPYGNKVIARAIHKALRPLLGESYRGR